MDILIAPNTLADKLAKEPLAIIDVRIKDDVYGKGKEAYRHEHIENAVYLDFKTDLSGEGSFLPSVPALAKKLGNLGITRQTPVVIYDEGNHRAASKTYVVLKYLGHDTVYILNGGFKAWKSAGLEVTDEQGKITAQTYEVELDGSLFVDMEDVKKRMGDDRSMHIDARAFERYTGEKEPKYKKAGHIPGAKNYPTKSLFNDQEAFKATKELQEHFSEAAKKEEVVVSCGSGNSACMNVVGLKQAGLENVKLYPGGFSEWIEDENNEVAKGED